jgi:hypothetical protein
MFVEGGTVSMNANGYGNKEDNEKPGDTDHDVGGCIFGRQVLGFVTLPHDNNKCMDCDGLGQ